MASWRDRGATALLVVVLLALAGATAYEAVEVSVRLRVDTPVSAEARGVPGCVTSGSTRPTASTEIPATGSRSGTTPRTLL